MSSDSTGVVHLEVVEEELEGVLGDGRVAGHVDEPRDVPRPELGLGQEERHHPLPARLRYTKRGRREQE